MRAHPVFVLVLAALAGCGKGKTEPAPASSAALPASAYSIPVGLPAGAEKVVEAVNPMHKMPYSGPKGTLRGIVRIDGDPPPDSGLKFPSRCPDSSGTYGKLWRVGPDKALADAMVAVTNYADRGFVPATDEVVRINIRHCVPPLRTYAITYGQRIDVTNQDEHDSYLPYLDGTPIRSVMVAVPRGGTVKLYPDVGKAHYMLRDSLESGLVADVFVLDYATHDVTGLDGKYEIKNIPVGKVRVDAFLPVIGKSDGKEIDIKEGDNTLDLTLHFDAEKDLPKSKAAPAPTASASAAPAASVSGKPRLVPSPFK